MTPDQQRFLMQIIVCMAAGWLLLYGFIRIGFAIRDLFTPGKQLAKEKDTRIKYQDIVYEVCNLYDDLQGNKVTRGEGITIECLAHCVRMCFDELRELRKATKEKE
jgi:hypothetical protein